MDEQFCWLPFLLQTGDGLFPTGSYAHSLGLEESVRLGLVSDEPSLRRFLSRQMVPALEGQELPYFRFAHDAAQGGEDETLFTIDREIGAWKLAYESRQASIQIGRRRLKALRVICDSPILDEFSAAIDRREAVGHQLTVCALQAIASAIPLRAALAAYFYQSLAAACTAALKLVRIGQEGCQRVLRGAANEADGAIARSLPVARRRAGCFNPLLEIASMRHERADERLFIS